MRVRISLMVGMLSVLCAQQSLADEHIIKGVITNWVPQVTYAKPGDTLKFVQMAGHDSQSIDGMIPEGAQPWKAAMGAEGFSVKLDKEGAYIFKCNPHMTTGMVGAVVVGEGAPPESRRAGDIRRDCETRQEHGGAHAAQDEGRPQEEGADPVSRHDSDARAFGSTRPPGRGIEAASVMKPPRPSHNAESPNDHPFSQARPRSVSIAA